MVMSATVQSLELNRNRVIARAALGNFRAWLRSHRDSVKMAGLLAFAAPVTFFFGALSVMRDPTAADMARLALWWLLYGFELWGLLLAIGYADQHLAPRCGRYGRSAIWLLSACAIAVGVTVSTAGRAGVLAEQGVVQGALTMHLHSAVFSFTMALLFLGHLRRSRTREVAAARLACAQAAQRDARRSIAQARLAAVQARIDPQLLFGMLEAVRCSYAVDAVRAECLLDELIAFLRAVMPQLRAASSSVPREAELARRYAGLHRLAGASDACVTLDVSAQMLHARFPPGVLLPLLDDALRTRAGSCTLTAIGGQAGGCRLALTLPARPSGSVVARVRALLADVYGGLADLKIDDASGVFIATVQVPYEVA